MRSLFLDPGRLRTELILQAPVRAADGQGGQEVSWSEVGSLFALVEPVSARGVFEADQKMQRVTHRVTIRARAGVAAGMRFARGGRILEIRAVHDPDESGRYLVCLAEEQGP